MNSDHPKTEGPLKELYTELYQDLPYQLERCIGSDSNSSLFKARHRASQAQLQVRIFDLSNPLIGARKEEMERLLSALKEIRHPNLMTLLDYSITEHRLVLASEPFESIPLQRYVEDPQNEPTLAFHACFQVLSGLEILHGFGVIHTDLSPNHILLNSSGEVKVSIEPPILSIFGFERGSPAGTPGYTAPELWEENSAPDISSDVFSFGSLLYFCVTGGLHPPRILSATKIPEKYREIVLCARGHTADARYRGLRELEYALLSLSGQKVGTEEPEERVFSLEELNDAYREDSLDGSSHVPVVEGNLFEMIFSGLKPYWKTPGQAFKKGWEGFKEQFSEVLVDTRAELVGETKDLVDQTRQKVRDKRQQRQEKSLEKKKIKEERKEDLRRKKEEERREKDQVLWEKQREEARERLKMEMERVREEKLQSRKRTLPKISLPPNFGIYLFALTVVVLGYFGYQEISFGPPASNESTRAGKGSTFHFKDTKGKIRIRSGPLDSWGDLRSDQANLPAQVRTEVGAKTTLQDPRGKLRVQIYSDSELTLSSFESDPNGFEKILSLTMDQGDFSFDLSRSRTLFKFEQTFGEISTRTSIFQVTNRGSDFKLFVKRGAIQVNLGKEGIKNVSPGEALFLQNGKISYHGKRKK